MTVCIGLFGYVFVVNFPEQIAKKPAWGFLKPNEVQFLLRRINRDRNDAEAGEFKLRAWAASGADPKIWGFALIFLYVLVRSIHLLVYLLSIQRSMYLSLRHQLLPTHHPHGEHGLRQRRSPVPFSTALRSSLYCHGSHGMARGSLPHSWTVTPGQLRPRLHWRSNARLGTAIRRQILRHFPDLCLSSGRYSDLHDLPGKQHPRPLEACVLFRHHDRFRGDWRHCRFSYFPDAG
jgi:hypothetical protein